MHAWKCARGGDKRDPPLQACITEKKSLSLQPRQKTSFLLYMYTPTHSGKKEREKLKGGFLSCPVYSTYYCTRLLPGKRGFRIHRNNIADERERSIVCRAHFLLAYISLGKTRGLDLFKWSTTAQTNGRTDGRKVEREREKIRKKSRLHWGI